MARFGEIVDLGNIRELDHVLGAFGQVGRHRGAVDLGALRGKLDGLEIDPNRAWLPPSDWRIFSGFSAMSAMSG